jgi:hypothetical protein
MSTPPRPEKIAARLAELRPAEIAVGLVTFGPTPSAAGVAAAARAGLEQHFAGRPAVLLHVDRAGAADPPAALVQAAGEIPLLHLGPEAASRAPAGRGIEPDGARRAILAAAVDLEARAVVILNTDLVGTGPAWVPALASPVLKDECALVLPLYHRYRYDGTLAQAVVVPLMRALFGRRLCHPIAEEFACSRAAAALLLEDNGWGHALLRDGLEFRLPAAVMAGGLPVGQATVGARTIRPDAHPAPLGPTVGRVASALFTLAERLDAAWLDVRGSEAVPTFGPPPELTAAGPPVDPERMLMGFRQGVRDLYPIWERILAPEQLGEILVLSDAGVEQFHFPDRLWARVVYDFLLGFHARVAYGSHIAQSLAPLYLGRVASVVLETRARPPAAVAEIGERLAREFEEQKPYLVDRWQ